MLWEDIYKYLLCHPFKEFLYLRSTVIFEEQKQAIRNLNIDYSKKTPGTAPHCQTYTNTKDGLLTSSPWPFTVFTAQMVWWCWENPGERKEKIWKQCISFSCLWIQNHYLWTVLEWRGCQSTPTHCQSSLTALFCLLSQLLPHFPRRN